MSADHTNRGPRAFTFDPAKMPGEERLDFAADNASDISRLVMDAEKEDALRTPFGWGLAVYAFDDPEGAGIIVAVGPSRIDLDDEITLVSASGLFWEWSRIVPRDEAITDHERAVETIANVVGEANVLLPYARAMFSTSGAPPAAPGYPGRS